MTKKTTKRPWPYIALFCTILVCWTTYMAVTHNFYLIVKHYYAIITMVFGATIAGSSPEGSAAVIYPVFTLFLKIPPPVARNFAFAIQSIGMTSASVLILSSRIKVEWNYIKYVTFGGIFGLLIGTYFVAPLIAPPVAKLFFVSLWLAFGIVLWNENRKEQGVVFDKIQHFAKNDVVQLLILGLIGGVISSIFGTGINIFSFCFMTIYYRINEKVAIPSSVIIMTIETLLGFFMHAAVIKDFQPHAWEMWLACIPFVAVFAPLGAYLINKVPRKAVANFLSFILFAQFVGAMYVLKPVGWHLWMSVTVLAIGVVGFIFLSRLDRHAKLPKESLAS